MHSRELHAQHKANITTADGLTAIWQRVLHRAPSSLEDNFFELGGDPWLAIKLFVEIEKAFAKKIPPLAIYGAPTVASLAALLEAPTPVRFPTSILLRAGTTGDPIFIAHGVGGNVLEFFELVRKIQSPRPIFGLQAKGTDGLEEPSSAIEEMAKSYVKAVKGIQDHGPYILIGYSFGGLVALEMARYLSASGEKIALLMMIDSYPSLSRVSLKQRMRVYYRKARHHASIARGSPLSEAISYAFHGSKRVEYASQAQRKNADDRASLGISFTPEMERVRECASIALRQYVPRYYGGRIKFVRASVCLHFPDDPAKIWVANDFELEAVPGDHYQILTRHSEELAAVINRHLRELPVPSR